jgi:hypothetical protein
MSHDNDITGGFYNGGREIGQNKSETLDDKKVLDRQPFVTDYPP